MESGCSKLGVTPGGGETKPTMVVLVVVGSDLAVRIGRMAMRLDTKREEGGRGERDKEALFLSWIDDRHLINTIL
jgi:hypothetical protein